MIKKILAILLLINLASCKDDITPNPEKTVNTNDFFTFNQKESEIKPPKAYKIPIIKNYFGKEIKDNYTWLEDLKSKETIDYLKEEETFSNFYLSKLKNIENELKNEFSSRIGKKELSDFEKIDEYIYYSKIDQISGNKVYYRRKDYPESREEVLFKQDNNFNQIKTFRVSPNHRYLAFSFTNDLTNKFKIKIKDLKTSELLKDEIKFTSGEIEWTNDSEDIYYCTTDDKNKTDKVYRRTLGDNNIVDKLIYQEKDPSFNLSINKSSSQSYILINSNSSDSSEVLYLGARDKYSKPKVLLARKKNIKYRVEHNAGKFFILTDSNAPNLKIMSVNVLEQYRNTWEEVVKEDPDIKLMAMRMFKNYLAILLKKNGTEKIQIYDIRKKKSKYFSFDKELYSLDLFKNQYFYSNKFYLNYSSFTEPEIMYEYDMKNNTTQVFSKTKIENYNPENYISEKLYIPSIDGEKVPVSIVYKKGFLKDGKNPILVEGYGAYGRVYRPSFSNELVSLLDRGFVYAQIHVRGSGELGKAWHKKGKGLNKRNSFYDFVNATNYLIDNKYGDSNNVFAYGKEHGGLLISATVNMNPKLFKAIILENPYTDIFKLYEYSNSNYYKNLEEFGDITDRFTFNYISSYNPYSNISQDIYPDILVLSDENSNNFAENIKFVAELRNSNVNTKVFFKKFDNTRMEANEKELLKYSFLLNY